MSKQRTNTIILTVNRTKFNNMKMVDQWLDHLFGIDVTFFVDKKDFQVSTRVLHDYVLSQRVQALVNTYLQFANVPAFFLKDVIINKSNYHSSEKMKIIISVTYIENINPKVYETAIKLSFQTLQWLSQKDINQIAHVHELYNLIDSHCYKPLKALSQGGKSTLPVLKVAYQRNIPFMHLGGGVYQLGWGSNSFQISKSIVESDSLIGGKITRNKAHIARVLGMANLPVPEHFIVSTEQSSLSAVKTLGYPVVVKPLSCERGEGVTVNIESVEMLSEAIIYARTFSEQLPVLVEKQVKGICYRLFISNGKLLYISKRWPISVIGDGKNTVLELISYNNQQELNKPPWLRQESYPNDALAQATMKLQGFTLSSIPKIDERISLRPFQSDAWGGIPEEVTKEVHPDNIEIALKAAKILGLYSAGVDFISPDISVPWHCNDAVINEVNISPLLGGNAFSKSHIPTFIQNFISGDGRIPIEVFIGGKMALANGIERHKEILSEGVNSCLTTHDITLYLSENELVVPKTGIMNRCIGLLMDKNVEKLVVIVQTDACLYGGMPFDQVDKLTVTDEPLLSSKDINTTLSIQESIDIRTRFEQISLACQYR